MYLSDAEKSGIAELATTLRERFGATEVTLTVSSDRLTNTPFRSAPIVSTIRREGQPL